MPLQTFERAIASVEAGTNLSLLIGNGFSRAWSDEIFNYRSLLDRADFGARNQPLRQLFERLGTFDFEAVMRALEAAETVVDVFGGNQGLLDTVRQDQQLLKEALVAAISRSHPERPHDVEPAQYTAARRLLARFGQVFTVNYDLLFYWARNQADLPPLDYETDDGFRANQLWHEYDTDQEVYFLHGGLHIYEDAGLSVRKLAHARGDVPIIDQVRANLERGRFPLFVAEPSEEKKRRRIERNRYLSYCLRALGKIDGTLFILGHAMDANDRHIFRQVDVSQVNRVMVSIHGDEFSDPNRAVMANARAFLENGQRVVEFFDATSAAVWG